MIGANGDPVLSHRAPSEKPWDMTGVTLYKATWLPAVTARDSHATT